MAVTVNARGLAACNSQETKRTFPKEEQIESQGSCSPSRTETLELLSPRDPRNWPTWKKNIQILMIAFHSMTCTFMAAGIIPAFEIFAGQYGVSVASASYLTSVQILLLGIFPFIWNPIASRYGRHHIFLLSTFGSMICNIGGAKCTSFGAQMTTRALTAVFISPPIGIGSGVVTELCDKHERAQKIGWWTLMTTVGTPGGPFIMGFVTQHLGVQWIFWIFAIINFCQFLGYLFLGSEMIFIRKDFSSDGLDVSPNNDLPSKSFIPRRIDHSPFVLRQFFEPLFLSHFSRILIPACAYAIVFCYANIALIVETPIAFGEKFHFNPQEIGLQFIAIIIGAVLGEQLSGPMSDIFLTRFERWTGHVCPADRLWFSYVGYATVFAGLLTWGFQLESGTSWNVTPCIGSAIASFGNQILTTTLISFAVDSHRERSTEIGVFVNFCRQTYGFAGPFYLPYLFQALGLNGAAGVMCGIIAALATIPTVVIQYVATKR